MNLLRRTDLVRAQQENPHASRRTDAVRAGMTGSGESLLVLTWTAAELARERAAGVRLLRAAGVSAGMRVANTLPGALATPGSLQLGDVVDELGGLDVPLGSIDNDAAAKQAWDLVDRVEPDVMVLDLRTAARFASAAPQASRRWWAGIVWMHTDSPRLQPPPLADRCGFTGWQRRWLAIAEVSSFVAMTCAHQHHHLDRALHAAIVDFDSGSPVHTGKPGALALGWSNQAPLYLSSLRVGTLAGACPCGTEGIALEIDP